MSLKFSQDLNAILGYLQESRAEKALATLKRLSSPNLLTYCYSFYSKIRVLLGLRGKVKT